LSGVQYGLYATVSLQIGVSIHHKYKDLTNNPNAS
jgi:hypothetical protein